MTAEEFLTEQEITKERMNNDILYKMIVNLMEMYASKKQIEAIDKVRELAKETFKEQHKPKIIMP